jgi:hypothetical protein
MIVFFIDADNLCVPSWVDEGFQKLEGIEGSVSVRRAYGSAEKLKGLADVLRTRLVRPFVNLALTKNTTDVALAVDAMEVSYLDPRPTTIAIGSGDADFVPLVLRLRERGFRMVCVSEPKKMAPEAVNAYHHVIYVGQDFQPVPQEQVQQEQAEKTVPLGTLVVLAPVKSAATAVAKKVAAKKLGAKKAPAKKVAAKKTAAPETGKVTIAQILKIVPALATGHSQLLGEVAKLLHEKKLLGKNATSTKLFKKFPFHFELLPEKQPHQVRYILPP